MMIRMLADEVVPRWTRTARWEWSTKQHELAMAGVHPIPLGIGLSGIHPKKEDK